MNKKLLFGIMSLAALTACTNDEFESQNVAQEESPIQFEVINNDVVTRAHMDGNKIVWNANDGDKFTLYHGGAVAGAAPFYLSGCENAIYTAKANEGATATLTTPSMIKQGSAVMVWPHDSVFRVGAGNLSIVIPAEQTNIEKYIPYVSDVVNIGAYNGNAPYNTAGLERAYPVYMRPMASQLIIKADYAGTDNTLASLYTGDDPIDPISVTSIELITDNAGADKFTTAIPLVFNAKTPADHARWNTTAATKVKNNAWSHVTSFDLVNAGPTTQVDKLTSKVLLENNGGCKFLMLPQVAIAGGADKGAIVVNTLYGKVVVGTPGTATGTLYDAAEAADAWYRYISAASKAAGAGVGYDATETPDATAGSDGKFKTTSKIEDGMMQTINGFSTYTHQGSSPVQTEPEGAAATRYVKVLLTHLDMTGLHVTSDKQLRHAAKVWKQMGLADVTVYLDGGKEGDAPGEFTISQTTIDKINEINATPGLGKSFKVMPCTVVGEACNTIVITGGGNIKDLTFIKDNAGTKAAVAFKAGENWKWAADNTVTVANTACGISKFINRGTFTSDATATINVKNDLAVPAWVNIPFENAEGATWNISGATLNVQFDVTNYGNVNIATKAQYRQDGQAGATTFINEATALPTDFGGNDAKIGKVENKGVFATVAAGVINNYGLIEHADLNAKTYITNNQLGGNFAAARADDNKMGRINLPWDNKNEDNVSVSAALNSGFVSVTVNGEVSGALDASVVGSKVNYVIVKSGITEIKAVSAQVKYLEINQPGTELAWNVPTTTEYDGLIVLSDVNIKLGTKIVATVTYLGADMYVGGKFNQAALAAEGTDPAYAATNFSGYYGDTSGNVGSKYITY